MHMCYCYSFKWRYEFNNTKSGAVTSREAKTVHYKSMEKREWILGEDTVHEHHEYKSLWVLKNYVGSFSSNIDDSIQRPIIRLG